jgi:hypothetical protein
VLVDLVDGLGDDRVGCKNSIRRRLRVQGGAETLNQCPRTVAGVARTGRTGRIVDGASQDLHSVAKDGVLELELRHASTPREHSNEADEYELDKRRQRAVMLPTSVNQE